MVENKEPNRFRPSNTNHPPLSPRVQRGVARSEPRSGEVSGLVLSLALLHHASLVHRWLGVGHVHPGDKEWGSKPAAQDRAERPARYITHTVNQLAAKS